MIDLKISIKKTTIMLCCGGGWVVKPFADE